MFSITLKLVLLSIVAAPQVSVLWADKDRDSFDLTIQGGEEFIDPCLKGGLSVAYRYSFELCHYSALWRDQCDERRIAIHLLSYDPISNRYIASQDLLRDDQPRTESSSKVLAEGIGYLTSVQGLPLRILRVDRAPFEIESGDYLSVNVMAWCEGEYNRTLARISSILTLGIYGSTEFDTGWTAFPLE